MVARLDAGDALPNALHNACCLVAQDAGEQALWVCTDAEHLRTAACAWPGSCKHLTSVYMSTLTNSLSVWCGAQRVPCPSSV